MHSKTDSCRASGILLHITSLPGPYGIGTLGREAHAFLDFLYAAKQSYWQVLPVGPTGYGNSPYQSYSTFAGNPLLIDPECLVTDGLLSDAELSAFRAAFSGAAECFSLQKPVRLRLLRQAFHRFNAQDAAFRAFCDTHAAWLDDYALFMAIKDAEADRPWQEWPTALRLHEPAALETFAVAHADDVAFYRFLQYLFAKQWQALKEAAHAKGIRIIGDLPIYVAEDSADTWSHPSLFALNSDRRAAYVGGCPPDAFTADGQRWGNPCYQWENHVRSGFSWWIHRLGRQFALFDAIRLDHFRGLESYWRIPANAETAREGAWAKAPGRDLFAAVRASLGDVPILAEDLGFLTPEVLAMREALDLPGMKVLQFAFTPDEDSLYLPHHITENSVIYTGTHDNDTVLGWLAKAPAAEHDFAVRYMHLTEDEGYAWGCIRTVMTSVARLAVLPMQDVLELGAEARMNTPGTAEGNWTWRMRSGAATAALAERLAEWVRLTGRAADAGEGTVPMS